MSGGLLVILVLLTPLEPTVEHAAGSSIPRAIQPAVAVSIGASSPLDEIRDRSGKDLALSGELRVKGRGVIRGGIGWMKWRTPVGTAPTDTIEVRRLTVDFVWMLNPLRPFKTRPHLGAGIGTYRFTSPDEGRSHPGAQAIAGLEYPIDAFHASIRGEATWRSFGSALGSRTHFPLTFSGGMSFKW